MVRYQSGPCLLSVHRYTEAAAAAPRSNSWVHAAIRASMRVCTVGGEQLQVRGCVKSRASRCEALLACRAPPRRVTTGVQMDLYQPGCLLVLAPPRWAGPSGRLLSLFGEVLCKPEALHSATCTAGPPSEVTASAMHDWSSATAVWRSYESLVAARCRGVVCAQQ
jgi:hypothetical protein